MNFSPGISDSRHIVQVIDVRRPELLDRWCRVFGVTRHELTSVVAAVGGNPDVVRRHLFYANLNSVSARRRTPRRPAMPCVSTA
jgi:hypothetical protein